MFHISLSFVSLWKGFYISVQYSVYFLNFLGTYDNIRLHTFAKARMRKVQSDSCTIDKYFSRRYKRYETMRFMEKIQPAIFFYYFWEGISNLLYVRQHWISQVVPSSFIHDSYLLSSQLFRKMVITTLCNFIFEVVGTSDDFALPYNSEWYFFKICTLPVTVLLPPFKHFSKHLRQPENIVFSRQKKEKGGNNI